MDLRIVHNMGLAIQEDPGVIRVHICEQPLNTNTAAVQAPQQGNRGTSLMRNTPPVGPYSSPMLRDIWAS